MLRTALTGKNFPVLQGPSVFFVMEVLAHDCDICKNSRTRATQVYGPFINS